MDNQLNLRVTFYSDHYQNEKQPNRNFFKNISWSPFDRTTFEEVTSLQKLCSDNRIIDTKKSSDERSPKEDNHKESDEKKEETESAVWTGVKQCMHLVEERFDDNQQHYSIWKVTNDYNREIFEITKPCEGQGKKYAFYCIYSMRFANDIQNLRTKEQIWDKMIIRKSIFYKVNRQTCNKDMEFKCFRSLGSEDMVIIFLANSMKDIISVVDNINKLDILFPPEVAKLFESNYEKKAKCNSVNIENKPIKLFSTICVFSGFNNPNYSGKTDIDLLVRLNLKENDKVDEVVNMIRSQTKPSENLNDDIRDFQTVLSQNSQKVVEYDEIIHKLANMPLWRNIVIDWNIFLGVGATIVYIPAGCIDYSIYHEGGLLNDSPYFYNSRTYFCVPKDVHHQSQEKKSDYLIDMRTLADEMESLNPDKFKKINSNSNNKGNPVANFIFDEYDRLICSQRTIQWHRILIDQYNSVKSFTEYYSSMNLKFEECDLLNYAQSALHLINQACSPVSEMPNHNHFYLGSFHDLMKTYYGIIGMIFNIGLNLPHAPKTIQHNINYAICLNSTARIESKIFTRHDNKRRFIIFFLPYDDFWNFSENIKLLIHEVFHYIAPYDRGFRAERFVKIMYSMLISERINMICASILKKYSIDTADMVETWKTWLIDKFKKSKEKELIEKLKSIFPGFFIYSNPEWEILYFDDRRDDIRNTNHNRKKSSESQKEVMNVLYLVDNDVKECIRVFHEEVMEYICRFFAKKAVANEKLKNVNFFIETLTPEFINNKCLNFDILTDYIPEYRCRLIEFIYFRLKNYSLAAKEAFCDIWSAKISDTDTPEYIAFVLEKMATVYPKEAIVDAISAQNRTTTKLDIRATVIRFLLLIHERLCRDTGKTADGKANDEQIKSVKRLFSKVFSNLPQNDYILRCVEELAVKYGEFITIAKAEINPLCEIAFDHLNKSFTFISELNPRGAFEMIRHASKLDLKNNIGMEAIDTFSHFIGKIIEPTPVLSSDSVSTALFHYNRIGEDKVHKMQVSAFGELLEAIKEIKNKVSSEQDQSHILWYRGVCSDKFSLLPSILRKGNPNLSIYANQANVIKRAYFSTLYAADIWNLPIEQRMACLQHYGMPTNLLDFSIDPFVALHFSINPDVAADREKIENGCYQPVIYVFDPIIYGHAIRKMTEWDPSLNIPSSISSVNFDINHNKEEKMPFFIDDMSYNYLDKHNTDHSKEYSPNDRGDPFPMPLVIQHSNLRITAQSGTFLAFSLNALPQRNGGSDRFDYLNLLRIQERYTRFLNETANYNEQFIFPIYLRKNYIASFREELKTLNINTGKFYPEISKIFEETLSAGLNDSI